MAFWDLKIKCIFCYSTEKPQLTFLWILMWVLSWFLRLLSSILIGHLFWHVKSLSVEKLPCWLFNEWKWELFKYGKENMGRRWKWLIGCIRETLQLHLNLLYQSDQCFQNLKETLWISWIGIVGIPSQTQLVTKARLLFKENHVNQ